MTRNITNIILGFFILILIVSCEDEDAVRIPEFQEGVNLRITLDQSTQALDASDLENASLIFNFYSENQNIDSLIISASLFRFSTGETLGPERILVFQQEDFSNEAIENVEVTSQQLAELFNLEVSDLGGGDRFNFTNVTKLEDGRVFPEPIGPDSTISNVAASISGGNAPSFSTDVEVFIACPIPDGFATGLYTVEQVSGPADPFFGLPTRWAKEQVNVTQVSPIERSFSGTYFTFGSVRFNFLLICDDILVSPTATGIGCGGPTLGWRGASDAGTYSDDGNEITINILENTFGACGLPIDVPLTLKLTKVE